jgi:hypothetical protein
LEGKNKPNDPEIWSACKSAAKKKFDVYPSAYANAWASKCYKKKGGSWRSVNEQIKFNILNNFMENAIIEDKTKRMYEATDVPLHPIQQRMNDSIKQKSSDNIARLRSLMGSPNSLNTENTPQTGTLAPEARADILSGDPKRQEGILRGFMHLGGKAAQRLKKMNKSKNINEGKVGSDKEKMEDPSSVGPPIDQAIIDAASLGGTTPLRVTPNVERILRDEQAYRNKLDTHINNYADYVNDLTKNIRLRSTGGYSKFNMYPEEGTR